MAELTEADAGGRRCWTVGLEATGPAGLLLEAVQHAAGLLLAWPLPDGARFSLSNSRSYAQWLYQQPGPQPSHQRMRGHRDRPPGTGDIAVAGLRRQMVTNGPGRDERRR
jgi:hypothetical protein